MPPSTANSILQTVTHNENEDGEGTNLADIILAKIAAHEAGQSGHPVVQGGGLPEEAVELPAKVVEVYSKYNSLSRKAFGSWLTSAT